MKLLAWMLILGCSLIAYAQDSSELTEASKSTIFKKAFALYSQGRYQTTVEELTRVEQNHPAHSGLINYWKGICYSRSQNFPEAIKSYDRALKQKFSPQDIHYEYGQALFAAEKLSEARVQFRESLRKKFKRGVSLYYIAYTSRELGDNKKAFTFFRSISKLDEEEAREVKQAAEMQIGDIYLEQVEKLSDAFKQVETLVIPQYEKAMEVDPESNLAPVIQEKIITLQRKYDLILLQLRNGRPALNPPYFVRASQEIGMDSNVTFAPAGTTISSSRKESTYSKTDFIGRYTFYHKDFISISPEFRFNYTYYFNRVPEIYRNDNYLLAPALRTAIEHTLWKKPASHLIDYDYAEANRDVKAKKKLEFSSRSHTVMLGERFNYFDFGETIVRLRYRMLESYLSSSDSNTTSFVVEQIRSLKEHTLLFFFSYDRMRVDSDVFDTDSFTLRADLIMGRVRDWFTPSIGFMVSSVDPVNDRSTRGRELLLNPNARLSKTFRKNFRGNLKLDYQKYNSKDDENFAYKKTTYAFEVEYLF